MFNDDCLATLAAVKYFKQAFESSFALRKRAENELGGLKKKKWKVTIRRKSLGYSPLRVLFQGNRFKQSWTGEENLSLP